MNRFVKYQSVKRTRKWREGELEQFLKGSLYVFPKLDGANTSIWLDGNGKLCYGSRNSDLSASGESFRGFYEFIGEHQAQLETILQTFNHNYKADCTLYGEWMVPHTVKTYEDDMWKKFWIFDVVYGDVDLGELRYVPYKDQQTVITSKEGYKYLIPMIAYFGDGMTEKELDSLPQLNQFGIRDGAGYGEGVVVKNYECSQFNWLKVIHDDFSNQKQEKSERPRTDTAFEAGIVDKYLDAGTVEKEYAKLMNEDPEMHRGKVIPRLFQQTFTAFVEDNLLAILKKYKNPTINYQSVKKMTDKAVRMYKQDLF